MYIDLEILNNNIKYIIRQKGITAKQMLIDLNLGVNTLTAIKNGHAISCDKLCMIADYLGVSMDYLMGRTENPEVNK